jgi:DNA-binding transcriptional LysR family regulator
MHRRYDQINIPIELVRTAVAIAELGSFTKAGEDLNLTQSAISSQVKRLQQLVGGDLFEKSGPGLRLNSFGESVVSYARRILALNDQILSLRGTPQAGTLRIGLPNGLTRPLVVGLVAKLSQELSRFKVYFSTGSVEFQAHALDAGYLDVAVLSDVQGSPPQVVAEWDDQLYWIRSPGFVLSPGALVPLVSWPGGLSDRHATKALQQKGVPHSNVFVSSEIGLRLAAVEAGLGLMVTPLRSVYEPLVVAKDHYLPPLPAIRAGIYAREGFEIRQIDGAISLIEAMLRERSAAIQ